ncbi:MAG TPA: hypothetical protein VKA49_03145 [Flavitalea sp.]|nr:hypothetical protein [Flavitalea sp.]
MANWKEQLQGIQSLRDERRSKDEQLYATKINLSKTENLLQKVREQQTESIAPNELQPLRQRIESLGSQLRDSAKEAIEFARVSASIQDQKKLIEFLEKKIQAQGSQINILSRQLEEEQSKPDPDRRKTTELRGQIKQLEERRKELEVDLEKAKRTQATLLQEESIRREKKQSIDNRRSVLAEQLKSLQQELADKMATRNQSLEELERKKEELEQIEERTTKELRASASNLQRAIEAIYIDPHPRRGMSNLDDSIPFLMMPVRIETRFVTTGRASELWLRVYPDDLVIHSHEPILTEQEVAEGKKYWLALFQAEKSGGEQKEDQKKDALNKLSSLFGAPRAAWVAKQTRPLNWDIIDDLSEPAQLNFPVFDLTKTTAWSQAPRTNLLPDRFVAMLFQANTLVKEQVGNIIPDELIIGPDPMKPDDSFVTKDNKLVFGEEFDWTSDFEKAIEVGLGFKIAITPAQAESGFDKILVLGVLLSADEAEGKKNLESLIDNHHYSPNGFSLVMQGTPTNNTEGESGFTVSDPFNNTSFSVEAGEPLFTGDDDCDGRNLAEALGIDYDPLQHIRYANATDRKEAAALNTAMYAATLGYYFDTMMQPVLTEQTQDELRTFFTRYITGRGPLPAIRAGNQPYGVLLTSDFSKWRWQPREPGWNNAFLDTMYKVLNHYHSIHNGLLNDLMFVGKPGVDPSALLMNILGLQAGSVSFHQRVGYSTDYLRNLDDFEYGGRYFSDMRESFDSKNALLNFLVSFGYDVAGPNNTLRIPQLLRLVFQHFHTTLDAANLVDNVPLSEKEIIRYYDETLKKNYLHWLLETTTVAALEKQDFGTDKKAPTALLYMQLRRALLLQLNKASVKFFQNNDVVLNQVLEAKNFHNIRPAPDLTKWEVMKAKVGTILPDHPQKNIAVAEHLLTTGSNADEAAFLNEMKAAIEFLANKPTARLERCFIEHMDTCTYRLDAWQSGLFSQRLLKQRRIQSDEERPQRRKGIYLGAYGWVENLRPSPKRIVSPDSIPEKLRPSNGPLFEYADNGGFVHTPSLNHAAAAAVLRSGYLSHATPEHPETMAVNLSSERIRRALFILQGIRNGQTLEALLGYQFERGLHDRASKNTALIKLNLYIYNFRDTFPIEQHYVEQQGNGTSTETIPANNVVNGLKLAEITTAFPYGTAIDPATVTPDERTAMEQEKSRLGDSLDAIKDLLLSESVYQLVQGNIDRTGAVMNALKDAHIPPVLDVIDTPRSSHLSFTNRVTVQLEQTDPDDDAQNPWFPIAMTPRARMEPGLNKWLKTIIGEPGNLVCRVSHFDADNTELGSEDVTIDKLNIQPIDLIYITGGELNTGANNPAKESNTSVSELESRIAWYYREAHALDDEQVKIEFMKPELSGKKPLGKLLPLLRSIKSIITDSRNLHAEDFDPPSKLGVADKNNPKGYDHAELLARVQQAQVNLQDDLSDLHDIHIILNEPVGPLNGEVTLEEIFQALDTEKLNFADIDFNFGNLEAWDLRQVLIRISNVGLPDSFPQVIQDDNENKLILLEQGRNVSRRIGEIDQKTNDLLTEAGPLTDIERKVATLVAAGKTILGDVFTIIPFFSYNNPADIQLSNANRDQLLRYATKDLDMDFPPDEWMQNVSHVRPRLAKWEYIRTLNESFNNDSLVLKPVQLPFRANDSWLAVEFPKESAPGVPFDISHDTLSITIHGDAAFATTRKQSGLLIDDWTELIPTNNEITGIAFNYNQPNAMPPQSLLLAVPAVEKGSWDWDELVSILHDTLLRSKLRAVEPSLLDKTNRPELGVLLPAILGNFSQFDLDIALDYRLNHAFYAETIPILTADRVNA